MNKNFKWLIFAVLKEHGQPLHYDVIRRILIDRNCKMSNQQLIYWLNHLPRIKKIDVGVYSS